MRRLPGVLALLLAATPLVAGNWTPAHAAGATWSVRSVTTSGCGDGAIELSTRFRGLSGGGYVAHTRVYSGGRMYTNEQVGGVANGKRSWGIYADSTYGPLQPAGSFPIPADQRVDLFLELERPKGKVLSSWHLVLASCNSGAVAFNAPTSTDPDFDLVVGDADKCPALSGGGRANGCPLVARSLTVRYNASASRFRGRLRSPSATYWAARQIVTLYRREPGRDARLGSARTDRKGKYSLAHDASKGKYYVLVRARLSRQHGETAKVRRSVTVG